MPDLEDGETAEVKGSAASPYILKNTGGVYSCSCPAWRNQSIAIEVRTCKHLRQLRGDEAELERIGGELPPKIAVKTKVSQAAASGGEAEEDTPGFLLAHSWENDVDLTGWWISEKLDGVRAYWDGSRFISRQGNVYMAPDWFIEGLPKDVHLDGELWLDRKMFQRAVSIVRRQDKNDQWKEITFVVFDAPRVNDVFEGRISYVADLMKKLGHKYARAIDHLECRGTEHLQEELARVEGLGGEGLMMRRPKSRYEVGRSSSLLKVKTFHDAEARVVDHQPGTGKHKGRLGALLVALADGTRFAIGTGFSDAERENPPEIGSIVTFRYQELSDRGVPRFPSYVRLRTDVESLPDNLEKSPVAAKIVSTPKKPAVSSPVRSAPSSSTEGDGLRFRIFKSPEGHSWQIAFNAEEVVVREITRTTVSGKDAGSQLAKKLIAEKLSAGYSEKGAASPVSVSNDEGASSTNVVITSIESPQTKSEANRFRRFEQEGDVHKFWEINVEGSTITVRFGNVGSALQIKSKSLAIAEAAQQYADNLINGKLASGYVETDGCQPDSE